MRCCFNVFPHMKSRASCILKIVFEFMFTTMTQRTRYKGPSNRFFLYICQCSRHRHLKSKVNFCTKYNVLNVLNLLNMTTFQRHLCGEGTYTVLDSTYSLIKSNLNCLQGITQKRTHLYLKKTRYDTQKYIQL